jgi:hypothetical protein
LGGAHRRWRAPPKESLPPWTAVSLREMRNLLFKIRLQYRAAHKRYARTQGFNSYANRIAIAHRQQNAL